MVTTLVVAVLLGATGQATGRSVEANASAQPVTATGATQARTLKDRFADAVNIKDFGAKGDGATDDTAAIQAAINAASYVFFPCASSYYKTTAPITLPNRAIRLQGAGFCAKIGGSLSGYVLDKSSLTIVEGPYTIDTLYVSNTHSSGGGIRLLGAVSPLIRGCRIEARTVGVDFSLNVFSGVIENSRIEGDSNAGVGVEGGTITAKSNDVVGWSEGYRLWGSGAAVVGGRMEVNTIGIRLGVDNTGASYILSRGLLSGISMEGNGTAIQVDSASNTVFVGIGHQGSSAYPGGSQYGIRVLHGAPVFVGCLMSGNYTKAAIYAAGGTTPTFIATQASNGSAGSVTGARIWDVGAVPSALTSFGGSNIGLGGISGVGSPDFVSAFATQGLSVLDMLNGTTTAKNLRGKDRQVGSGASSIAVTFPITRSSGLYAISAATPTSAGGSLSGTYYYCATLVNELGEGACIESTATVSGGNNAVAVSFYGFSGADDWKHRLYRGTASGVYDGYYDMPVRSAATYTDTGAAFTGVKSPPAGGTALPSGAEADASYSVTCAPQWDATCWVTSKATTGFTLNFDPAPVSTSAVDWHLIR